MVTDNIVFSHGALVTAGTRWTSGHLSIDGGIAVPLAFGRVVGASPIVNVAWQW